MPWQEQLRSVESVSLPSQITGELRKSIFEGNLLPGTQLREQHLAARFGVSQNTVREALIQLRHVGLVQRSPHRGTHVTRLTDEDIRERIAVRLPLEVQACIGASRRIAARDVEEMRGLLETLSRAMQVDDYSGFALADLAFHRHIWKLAGNRTLSRVLDELTSPLFAFMNIYFNERSLKLADVADPHEPIFQAMCGQNAARIEEAITDHILNSYDRLLGRPAEPPAQPAANRGDDEHRRTAC